MQRDIYHTTDLVRVYTQLGGKNPFVNVSKDSLGLLNIQLWVGIQKLTNKYTVFVKCLDFKAVRITIAESLDTSQITF